MKYTIEEIKKNWHNIELRREVIKYFGEMRDAEPDNKLYQRLMVDLTYAHERFEQWARGLNGDLPDNQG